MVPLTRRSASLSFNCVSMALAWVAVSSLGSAACLVPEGRAWRAVASVLAHFSAEAEAEDTLAAAEPVGAESGARARVPARTAVPIAR